MGLFCFLCPGIPLGTRRSGEAIPDLGMLSGWVFVVVVVCFLEYPKVEGGFSSWSRDGCAIWTFLFHGPAWFNVS